MVISYTTTDYFYGFVISFILILIQKYFLSQWLKNKNQKERRELWVQFLRSNDGIEKCLSYFENLEFPRGFISFILIVIAATLGLYLSTIFFLHSQTIFANKWPAGAYQSLINFVPFIATVIISVYINKSKKMNLLNKANMITTYFMGINWFIITSNILILIVFFANMSSTKFNLPADSWNYLPIYFFSYYVLSITIVSLKNIKNHFFNNLKSIVNEQFLDDFPYIHITTREENIEGLIQNIFNEELIILDNNGLKIVVEWNAISTLKLGKKKIITDLNDF